MTNFILHCLVLDKQNNLKIKSLSMILKRKNKLIVNLLVINYLSLI